NDMIGFAKTLNLDLGRFIQNLDAEIFMPDVDQDLADVSTSGVNATPTFIINGRLHPGVPSFDEFSAMIDKELAGGTD
ncbi:MAG: DsbA family protein, partial [Desulfobacterales bacterium]|nr:DsbA family protein [Desulfobacterales bacterium]